MATRRGQSSGHRYPRSARLNEILREVIADELVRIDDERLAFVTITGIDVDNEMNRASVFFDSLAGEEGDDEIIDVLNQHRRRLQSSINRQMHVKKTPILEFRADEVIRSAERIDAILREHRTDGDRGDDGHPAAGAGAGAQGGGAPERTDHDEDGGDRP